MFSYISKPTAKVGMESNIKTLVLFSNILGSCHLKIYELVQLTHTMYKESTRVSNSPNEVKPDEVKVRHVIKHVVMKKPIGSVNRTCDVGQRQSSQ